MARGGSRENAGRVRRCIACDGTILKGTRAFRLTESFGGFQTHGKCVAWLCEKHGEATLSVAWHLRAKVAN